jgi:hypothetical protein
MYCEHFAIASFNCYPCMPSLDNVRKEPESEVQADQVQEEYTGPQAASCVGTNIVFEQGNPRCIPPIFLDFSF